MKYQKSWQLNTENQGQIFLKQKKQMRQNFLQTHPSLVSLKQFQKSIYINKINKKQKTQPESLLKQSQNLAKFKIFDNQATNNQYFCLLSALPQITKEQMLYCIESIISFFCKFQCSFDPKQIVVLINGKIIIFESARKNLFFQKNLLDITLKSFTKWSKAYRQNKYFFNILKRVSKFSEAFFQFQKFIKTNSCIFVASHIALPKNNFSFSCQLKSLQFSRKKLTKTKQQIQNCESNTLRRDNQKQFLKQIQHRLKQITLDEVLETGVSFIGKSCCSNEFCLKESKANAPQVHEKQSQFLFLTQYANRLATSFTIDTQDRKLTECNENSLLDLYTQKLANSRHK